MIYFNCDYTEGAHPRILEKLMETNYDQTIGYGMDEHCEKARAYIKKACNSQDADVHSRLPTAVDGLSQLVPKAGHDARHPEGEDEGRGDDLRRQTRYPPSVPPRPGLGYLGHQEPREGGDEGRGKQHHGKYHAVYYAVGGQGTLPTGPALLEPAGDEDVLEGQKP